MKLLLAPIGSRGDVEPMLVLGKAMRERGHDVLVGAPPALRDFVESRGLRFHPVGTDLRAWRPSAGQENRREGVASRTASIVAALARRVFHVDPLVHQANRWYVAFLFDQFPRQLSDLLEVATGFDLIIGEALQIAAPTVAEVVGADYRRVVFNPVSLRSDSFAPLVLPFFNLPSFMNRAFWRAFQVVQNRHLLDRINDFRARYGLDPIDDVYEHAMGEAIVATDPELAPVPADVSVPHTQTGCWLATETPTLDPELEAWIGAGTTPIYIGFGSTPDVAPTSTARCLVDAAASAGARAVISRGQLDLGGVGLPEFIRVVGEVSFARLFPRMAAVVHHGGTGTTNVAARAGVPQLIVPHIADQHYYGQRVHELGIGPSPITRTKLTSDGLSRAILRMLTSSDMTARAAGLGERLRRRDGVAEGVAVLERIEARRRASRPVFSRPSTPIRGGGSAGRSGR